MHMMKNLNDKYHPDTLTPPQLFEPATIKCL